MRIALITGASSGLGREFARRIDRTEPEIDEIWLTARRRERLEELAAELSHPTRVLPGDLTEPEFVDSISQLFQETGAQAGLLVNCAGYAKIGNYARVSRFDSAHMIDLNCRAAVDITLAVLPYMKARDRIIQICSTAAFQPLQHMNIYAASKAFLYSYTRALRTELLPRRIIVTAVCPFWIKDTEFIGIARDSEANQDGAVPIRHFFLAVSAESVARNGLRCSRHGRAVCTPGVFSWFHRVFTKVIPRQAAIYIWELLRRI